MFSLGNRNQFATQVQGNLTRKRAGPCHAGASELLSLLDSIVEEFRVDVPGFSLFHGPSLTRWSQFPPPAGINESKLLITSLKLKFLPECWAQKISGITTLLAAVG
jgi:hypothetical protein